MATQWRRRPGTAAAWHSSICACVLLCMSMYMCALCTLPCLCYPALIHCLVPPAPASIHHHVNLVVCSTAHESAVAAHHSAAHRSAAHRSAAHWSAAHQSAAHRSPVGRPPLTGRPLTSQPLTGRPLTSRPLKLHRHNSKFMLHHNYSSGALFVGHD
eukprot:COSAG01_NODE_26178_length_721_cov_3.598071_1_plen_157_part_00